MIICITGMRGAGKSSVADILKKKGFAIFEMHDAIISEMKKRKLEINNETMKEFAINIRKRLGPDIVARKTYSMIRRSKNKNVVITGVRSDAELKYFKSHAKDIVVVSVSAPQKIRFMRLRKRKRSDDVKSMSAFLEREKAEKKLGIVSALNDADYIIANTGTMRDLKKNVDMLINKLEGKN
ncbi:MAG: AAA family ATPase [Candidatus Micrarchaeia archaeon]